MPVSVQPTKIEPWTLRSLAISVFSDCQERHHLSPSVQWYPSSSIKISSKIISVDHCLSIGWGIWLWGIRHVWLSHPLNLMHSLAWRERLMSRRDSGHDSRDSIVDIFNFLFGRPRHWTLLGRFVTCSISSSVEFADLCTPRLWWFSAFLWKWRPCWATDPPHLSSLIYWQGLEQTLTGTKWCTALRIATSRGRPLFEKRWKIITESIQAPVERDKYE